MTSQTAAIRAAQEADYEAMNRLYHAAYDNFRRHLPEIYKNVPKPTLTKSNFLYLIEEDTELLRVAEVNSEIVGMVNASVQTEEGGRFTHAHKCIVIDDIYVVPEYRRHGIARTLVASVEAWADSKNISRVTALVYGFNQEAQRFFTQRGYDPFSTKFKKDLAKEVSRGEEKEAEKEIKIKA